MKFALVFVAVLGVACVSALPRGPRDIHDDIEIMKDSEELFRLIPFYGIAALVRDHLANDAEFQQFDAYLKSDDFKNALTALENKQEFKDLKKDLDSYGFQDAYSLLTIVKRIIDGLVGTSHRSQPARSVKSFLDDMVALFSKEAVMAFYDRMMKERPHFKKAVVHLQSAEFKELFNAFRALPEEQVLEKRLEDYGIIVDDIINRIKQFFGWTF